MPNGELDSPGLWWVGGPQLSFECQAFTQRNTTVL